MITLCMFLCMAVKTEVQPFKFTTPGWSTHQIQHKQSPCQLTLISCQSIQTYLNNPHFCSKLIIHEWWVNIMQLNQALTSSIAHKHSLRHRVRFNLRMTVLMESSPQVVLLGKNRFLKSEDVKIFKFCIRTLLNISKKIIQGWREDKWTFCEGGGDWTYYTSHSICEWIHFSLRWCEWNWQLPWDCVGGVGGCLYLGKLLCQLMEQPLYQLIHICL